MNNLTKLLAGTSLLVPGMKGLAQNVTTPQKQSPNIVLIFTDDMGYGDLGTFGATQFQTPNLDRLASEGMRFTNFYVSQAVCSASRASLLTGCYSNRVGINGALNPHAKIGLNPEEETIADVLKSENYATGMVGKWHLGHLRQFLPLQQGFDEYLGILYSNDMWPLYYDNTRNVPPSHKRKNTYPELPLIKGNELYRELKSIEDQNEITTVYTEAAVDFIRRKHDDPFFLYVAHSMPHVPLAVSDKFKGKSEQGLYGDVMMEIDWSVGEILNALDEYGVAENTLVIFTSDNGPWLCFGDHAGSAGGLREGKGTSYEGGQRVPCIMKWPGVIPESTICNKLSSTIDVLPTLAEITGATMPKAKIDGVNILPLLKGEQDADPRRVLYYYYGNNQLEAVRKDNWKLVFPHDHRSYVGDEPGQNGLPGPTHTATSGLELYDLRRDPGEQYDVSAFYPEKISELQALAEKAREDMGDSLTGNEGANRREPGRASE